MKKRIFAMLLVVALVLGLVPVGAYAAEAAPEAEGATLLPAEAEAGDENEPSTPTGHTDWTSLTSFTEGETYYIATADDLAALAALVNAGNNGEGCEFKLTADIDLSTKCGTELGNWTQIGNSSTNYFGGTFNGANHTISNLYLYNDKSTKVGGLFSYIKNATIKDVTLTGQMISIKSSVGCWAYQAENSTFSNCTNNASLTVGLEGKTAQSGGGFICAGKSVTFNNCVNNGNISGPYCAGFAYRCESGSNRFENCTNTGSVSNTFDKGAIIAGIICTKSGSSTAIELDSCKNTGNITATYKHAYGLVGANNAVVTNCENTGSVESKTNDACGIGDGKSFNGCINRGNVIGAKNAAGVCGSNAVTIINCINYGKVQSKSATNYCAGIIPRIASANAKTLSGCVNYGEVIGYANIGGIAGYISATATIKNCYNRGKVTGNSIEASKEGNIGGLIGSIQAQGNPTILIEACYNAGSITAVTPNVGGLIGGISSPDDGNNSITLADCYNAGDVTASANAGGMIGSATTTFTMQNCYSVASTVTATDGTAGMAFGSISAASALNTSNLFVRQISGLKTVYSDTSGMDINAVIPLTHAQMTDASFVTHLGTAFAKFSTDIYNGGEYSESDWATYTEYYGDYPYPILVSTCGASPLGERCNVQFLGAQYAKVTVNGYETYATTVTPGSEVRFTIETGDPEITVTSVAVGDTTLEATNGTYSHRGRSSSCICTATGRQAIPSPATTMWIPPITLR